MIIELDFEKDLTRLAGYPFGVRVYEEQVKNNIVNFDDKIIIKFPERIEKIASSFTQGFFSNIVSQIGYGGVEEKVEIITRSKELSKSVMDNLY